MIPWWPYHKPTAGKPVPHWSSEPKSLFPPGISLVGLSEQRKCEQCSGPGMGPGAHFWKAPRNPGPGLRKGFLASHKVDEKWFVEENQMVPMCMQVWESCCRASFHEQMSPVCWEVSLGMLNHSRLGAEYNPSVSECIRKDEKTQIFV